MQFVIPPWSAAWLQWSV